MYGKRLPFQAVKKVSIEVGGEEEAENPAAEKGSKGLWDPTRCVIS
jgi:hypothetical protein